ncbi:MAG: ChaN family lipoprotein [Campylobacter sp.]|nr:ChaN family lipoprotein [Campylobacter sp.]
MVKKIALFAFLFIFVGCATKKLEVSENFSDFKILDLKNKEFIAYNDFIPKLLKNDIILLGEAHDNMIHHFLEQKIILDLAKHKKVDVILEMGESNKQNYWDKAMQNRSSISPKYLANTLKWDKKWNYEYYGNLIERLFYSDINLIAGNLNKDEIDTIYSGAKPLYGKRSTTKAVKEKIRYLINKNHNIDDNEILEKMVEIQQYKDRRMADKLVHSQNLAVLIAGKFHIYKDMGVLLHIDDFKTDKTVIVVVFENDSKNLNNYDENLSDYIVIIKKDIY